MKNQKKWSGIIIIGAIIMVMFVISLASCATTVPISSARPPTIDTSGVKNLGMSKAPFSRGNAVLTGVGGNDVQEILNYLNDRAPQIIRETNRFTMVADNDPSRDGVFTGEIRSFKSEQTSQTSEQTRNQVKVMVTTYTRTVTLEFRYEVTDPRTNQPIGTVTKNGSQSSSSEDPGQLASNASLAIRIIDSKLKELARDVAPTIVTSNRKLMNETSKDKVVKARMKIALNLVKAKDYEAAILEYDAIATEFNSAAARANAGILRESISSAISAQAELAELYKAESGDETAVNNVIQMLTAGLPAGSNIIVMEGSGSDYYERNRLQYVLGEVKSKLIESKAFTIVEQNRELANIEQQYQLSGNVDDSSIVSIGSQVGAQFIIQCSITGTGSQRKFNVNVLSVETSTIILHNNFDI